VDVVIQKKGYTFRHPQVVENAITPLQTEVIQRYTRIRKRKVATLNITNRCIHLMMLLCASRIAMTFSTGSMHVHYNEIKHR
jgi:hypothetical protein